MRVGDNLSTSSAQVLGQSCGQTDDRVSTNGPGLSEGELALSRRYMD
jgi:hypothetical protein